MLTAAQQKLVTDNINFAYYLVNKWVKRQDVLTRDDLDGIVHEAICKAAVLYDPARGCSFINFSKMHINHTIIKQIRNEKLHKEIEKRVSQEFRLNEEDDWILNIDLNCAIAGLSQKKQRDIILEYYFNGLSRKEIAFKYGISINHVKYLLSLTRGILKEKTA